jgi:hypothetical protein
VSIKQYCDALERSKSIPKIKKRYKNEREAMLGMTHEFRETTPSEFYALAWSGRSASSYTVYL